MNVVVASICLSGALFAVILSTVSLVIHWTRRHEPPEITAILTRIQEIQTQHLDLLDKVEHWRKRDNVRRARQGAEDRADKEAAGDDAANNSAAAHKLALRRKATSLGLGIASS